MQRTNNAIKNSPSLIILGAGSPQKGENPTSLHSTTNGASVIDWQLQAFEGTVSDVHFVGGYQIDRIIERYPGISYSINPDWHSTGAASSLLKASMDRKRPYYVSYGDILYRNGNIERMERQDKDVVVAIDRRWRTRFSGRTEEDMARCEKVKVGKNTLTYLGAGIDPDAADAEFIGLVRFSPSVISYILDNQNLIGKRIKKGRLSDLVELLRLEGFDVGHVDFSGDWAELYEPRDLAKFILGSKAKTLERLQGMVRLSVIEDQVNFTVSEWLNGSERIIDNIATSLKGHRVVVRSSALAEDGFNCSNAGAFKSILNVSTDSLKESIEDVISSYPDGNGKNEVLVQVQVEDVVASGVAFTRTLKSGSPYYVLNYDKSSATDGITSGNDCEDVTLIVHRDSTVDLESLPEEVHAVMPAIQEIEELLQYDSLDIEFAVDSDGLVHILQVRPIVSCGEDWGGFDEEVGELISSAKDEFVSLQKPSPYVKGKRALFGIMPDWNPAEIIGTNPGSLAISLYRHLIMDDVWAEQRAGYGYRDVRPCTLLRTFAGHPYVDVRASFNSFIPSSVPDSLTERLVDFYLRWLEDHPHLHDKVEFGVVPTCFALDFHLWEKRLIESGGFSGEDVASLKEGLRRITRNAFKRNAAELHSVGLLEKRYWDLIDSDIPPLEKAFAFLEDCKRYGTLAFSHLARSAFVAVTMLNSAVTMRIISEEAKESFMNSIRTVTHTFTTDSLAVAQGGLSWNDYVQRYGHLRPGTYDITSLSYAEDPEGYLRPIVENLSADSVTEHDDGLWQNGKKAFFNALMEENLIEYGDDIEGFLRGAIEGREYAKFIFTRNLSSALDSLKGFGDSVGISRKEMAELRLEDLSVCRDLALSRDEMADRLKRISEENYRTRLLNSSVELPPLITSTKDFTQFVYPRNQPNYIGAGRVMADCVCLDDDQKGQGLKGKIVMIPQADPGYDWLFGQDISGLITMYGGANSHMAIRSAEFGLPAAIGVGEVLYGKLKDATMIDLDCGNRTLKVIR